MFGRVLNMPLVAGGCFFLKGSNTKGHMSYGDAYGLFKSNRIKDTVRIEFLENLLSHHLNSTSNSFLY